MMVEIICVGNELLSGITLNSNAHWLAGQITAVGGTVRRVTVVRDDLSEISSAVTESLARRPDMVITTGGLGATYDDMTLEGVALALGRKVVLDQEAVEMLRRSYARRHLDYELNSVRLKMATIPGGSTPLENMVGSAPAVTLENSGTRIYCLQGVPREMQEVFTNHILVEIRRRVGPFVSMEANYFVQGVTEAMIAPALLKIVNSTPREAVYIKTHPQGYGENNLPQIRAHLITRGSNEEDVKKLHDQIAAVLLDEISKLGGRIVQ